MTNYIILFILFAFSVQHHRYPLENTTWEYLVADDCVSYIQFNNDSSYVDYDCERNYPYTGKYIMKNDTIILMEMDLLSDVPSEKIKTNYKIVLKGRAKLLYKIDYLKYISWEAFENNNWQKSVVPSNTIIYIKKP